MNRIIAAALLIACITGAVQAADATHVTTQAELDAILAANEGTVLLDFHASWCGPCKMLAKEIETVTTAHPDEVTVVKVDIDKAEALATAYKVSSIPHLVLFKGGKQTDSAVGYMKAPELTTWLGLK
ncbi:MAG TPA: thioredoxin [Planctomycetota bacterium]|nr:thioredoxin [Planctomycetota bacterium]